MVNVDTRLPLMVQQPNILAALDAGTRAAGNANNFLRQVEGQNLFRRHGAGAMQGQQNALAAIAGYDPTVALNMQNTHLGMQATRKNMQLTDARIEEVRRQAREAARATEDKKALQIETEQGMRLLNSAAAGDARAWEYLRREFQLPDTLTPEEGLPLAGALIAGLNDELVSYNERLQGAVKGPVDEPASVQSSEVYPNGATLLIMRDGSRRVMSPNGALLEGDAAAAAIDEGQRMRAEYDRAVYAGRREGTNEAEAATGAEAAAAGKRGEQGVALAGDFFNESRNIRSNLRNLQSAIDAIDEGAKSGVVYNMLPDITAASASLRNAMNRMGLDVIGSVTFGALSEGEMRLAMETAVPQNLEPQELRKWLVRKRDAQEKALEGVEEAVAHFSAGGTLEEWNQKVRGWRSDARNDTQSAGGDYPTFEAFSASETIQNAARGAGVTVEDMWEIYQQRQGQ